MNLKTQEIESVIKLEPFERYKYSLKRIADNETLYTIKRDNETIAISDLDDEKLYLVAESIVKRIKAVENK